MATRLKRPRPVSAMEVRARVARPEPNAEGKWYWRCWRTINGEQVPLGSGWWTVAEAERTVVRLADGDAGRAPARGVASTVRDLLEFWIGAQEQRPDLSKATLHIRKAAARHLRDGLGTTLTSALDRLALDRYRDRRLREPVYKQRKKRDADGKNTEAWEDIDTGRTTAPRTVHLEILLLRMAWRYGREVGLVDRELPSCTVKVRGYVRNRKTPTPTETAAVMATLDGWARLALLLYAGTGARLDEIATLRWRDVDLEAAEVTVTGKQGQRLVPIAPQLVAALVEAGPAEPDARILTCAYTTSRAIYDRLEVACRHANVPRFAPGGLRRAAVVALYRSSGDPSVAGAVIGHSPIVAMRHYREVGIEEKHQAIRAARLGQLPDASEAGKVVELADRRNRGA